MSEKRFTIETFCDGDTEYKCLFDNEKEKEILSDDGFWFEERYSDVVDKLNKLSDENERLQQQHQRLYNYFQDYLEDEMSGNAFSEMWDNVKEDERWNDE